MNMSDANKWKSKLLSSSVPLEYEVARTLVKHRFAVNADYSYARNDEGIAKDFSVDLRATSYLPTRGDNISGQVDLLVECKHRHRGNKWLFFPDPNHGDMSPFTLGCTIRAVDSFTPLFLPANCTVSFDQEAQMCIKGVEVDTANGNVTDAEIRRGMAQLQYALPGLLTDHIGFTVNHSDDEKYPYFFCPILVTTSELLVANTDITIAAVEGASSLNDLGTSVPYLVTYLDCNPDFERHRQATCTHLKQLARHPAIRNLDALRKAAGEYDFLLPSIQCSQLGDTGSSRYPNYFCQTVVCSLEHFSQLLVEIKAVVSSAIRERKKTKPTRKTARG